MSNGASFLKHDISYISHQNSYWLLLISVNHPGSVTDLYAVLSCRHEKFIFMALLIIRAGTTLQSADYSNYHSNFARPSWEMTYCRGTLQPRALSGLRLVTPSRLGLLVVRFHS